MLSLYTCFIDDEEDRMSQKVLSGLENIDDDLERSDIVIVKMSTETNDISNLGIKELPAVVFFDNKEKTIFEGMHLFRNDANEIP